MDPTEYADIGPARGGRRKSDLPDLIIHVVRSLTPEDLPALQNPDSLGTTPIPLQTLRASHHNLAQMLAKGVPDNEAALITGYTPTRISILKKDPAFAELMAGYREMRENLFVDTLERMRILGLSTLDELQDRLEREPQKWSNRELMEMAELLLVKPRIATPMGLGSAAGGGPANQGVTVNVQFVKADTPPLTIEGKAELVNAGGERR